jgi:hypothetical protein
MTGDDTTRAATARPHWREFINPLDIARNITGWLIAGANLLFASQLPGFLYYVPQKTLNSAEPWLVMVPVVLCSLYLLSIAGWRKYSWAALAGVGLAILSPYAALAWVVWG